MANNFIREAARKGCEDGKNNIWGKFNKYPSEALLINRMQDVSAGKVLEVSSGFLAVTFW